MATSARKKFLIFLLIVIIIGLAVVKIGGPYYDHYNLSEIMDREIGLVNTASARQRIKFKKDFSEVAIRKKIKRKAKEYGIDLDDDELEFSRKDRNLIAKVNYIRVIDLYLYEFEIEFEHETETVKKGQKKIKIGLR